MEQVSDMTYATNIFYDHLMQVPDWETIPIEDAAQEVQRSGYPGSVRWLTPWHTLGLRD